MFPLKRPLKSRRRRVDRLIVTVINMFRFKAPIKYRFHRSDDNEGGSALSWKARFSGITKEVPCRAGRSGGLRFLSLGSIFHDLHPPELSKPSWSTGPTPIWPWIWSGRNGWNRQIKNCALFIQRNRNIFFTTAIRPGIDISSPRFWNLRPTYTTIEAWMRKEGYEAAWLRPSMGYP